MQSHKLTKDLCDDHKGVVSFSGKTGAETSTVQKIPMGRKEHPLL